MAANTNSLDLESGSSQYASIADASQTGLDFSSTFSLAGWFNFESLPADGTLMSLINKADRSAVATISYRMFLQNTTGQYRLHAEISDGAASRDRYYVVVTPSVGNWYHYGVTCNSANASATTFVFYVGGSSAGNGTAVLSDNVGTIANTSEPFIIGAGDNTNPDTFVDGLIDEVVATSDVMIAQEMADLFAGYTATSKVDNVKGYWKLNNDYADASGNSNTLTATGSPVFSSTVPFANYADPEAGGGETGYSFIW